MIFQEYETVVGLSGMKYVVVENGVVVSRHPSFRDGRRSLVDRKKYMTIVCRWCFQPFSAKKYVVKKFGKKYLTKSIKQFCGRKCANNHRWDSYKWNEHVEKLRNYGPRFNPRNTLENPPSKMGF